MLDARRAAQQRASRCEPRPRLGSAAIEPGGDRADVGRRHRGRSTYQAARRPRRAVSQVSVGSATIPRSSSPILVASRRSAVRALRPTYRHRRPRLAVRREIPVLLNARGLTGTGAEIGVKTGAFSEEILSLWDGQKLVSIDPWLTDPSGGYQDIANVDQKAHDDYLDETRRRLQRFGNRSEIWRLTSGEAAPKIPDGSLDFAYIDARHDYVSVMEDLSLWWPKIKSGGLLAGHDYVDVANEHGDFGVKSAVDEFATKHDRRVICTFADTPWCLG